MGAFKNAVVKNAPTILACLAGAGTVVTVVLTRNGTLSAEEELEKHRRQLKGIDYDNFVKALKMRKRKVDDNAIAEELGVDPLYVEDILDEDVSKTDKAKIYAKAYWPAAVMATATLLCIFGGNHISKTRIAGLGAAYILSEGKLRDYKKKVEELYGKAKAQAVEDSIIEDKIAANPPSDDKFAVPTEAFRNGSLPLSQYYDELSDRYFWTNPEYIRRAEIEVQEIVKEEGSANANDVYARIGLSEIPLGEFCVWDRHPNGEIDKVEIKIGSMVTDLGYPVGTITMNACNTEGAWFSAA